MSSTPARTLTLTLPRPHRGQREILRGAKRFNAVACGRRFGKTTMGLERLVRPALAGYPTAWFAPTYKYLAEVWATFVRTLKPVTARVNATERVIELVTGGKVEFWTLDDPDAGRSRKYKQVVVDEAAKARNLEAAWNEAIRPTLTDLRGGADFYSTPKGRNFFWKCWTRGRAGDPAWSSWQMPTVANPYIDPAEVEEARGQLPERVFRQEYLAEFLDDAGGVFRLVREAVDPGRTAPDEPVPGCGYVLGVDLARVQDFTVITALDAAGRQAYFDRFNQVSWARQIEVIRAAAARYPGAVMVDSTGVGDPVSEALINAGLTVVPFVFTAQSKTPLVDKLALAIEQGRLRLMDLPVQTDELLAFEYEMTPSRNWRMGAPEGMHDDCVMALGLGNWGADRYAYRAPTPEELKARADREKAEKARKRAEFLDEANPHWWGGDTD